MDYNYRGGSRGRVQGVRTPPPPRDDLRFSNTTGILQKKKTMWFIGVEVEQETSAPPPKKILDPPLNTNIIIAIINPEAMKYFHISNASKFRR